ncbi:MAG: hypothetical protein V7K98_22185 [Nostoc sp.]|uniref:hypothetical protein n=1 Tax=Nostoc sp. TaxID=1180 RepID=UPI002FFC9AE8
MPTFDRLEIRINPSISSNWIQSRGICVAEIYINNEPLIELVRQIEEPFVRAEIEERRAEGEKIREIDFLAGDYLYLLPSMVVLPSRNLLNEPWNHNFSLEAGDPRIGKATVLGCTCGVIQCWFMLVRITLNESTVQWSEFSQFHRDWQLDLGQFRFDREQYEFELSKPG